MALIVPLVFRVLALQRLIELKLASGMTAPHRLRDLADVIDLIRAVKLPAEVASDLDPYVRQTFLESLARGTRTGSAGLTRRDRNR